MKGGCNKNHDINGGICWWYMGSFCRITVVLKAFEFPFCFFFVIVCVMLIWTAVIRNKVPVSLILRVNCNGPMQGSTLHRSLISIFSSKIANFFCDWINEYSLIQSQKFENCIFLARILMIFFRISRQILENSDVCRFVNQICENKSEICRKFWILWKQN